jgi:hypothetical protein
MIAAILLKSNGHQAILIARNTQRAHWSFGRIGPFSINQGIGAKYNYSNISDGRMQRALEPRTPSILVHTMRNICALAPS